MPSQPCEDAQNASDALAESAAGPKRVMADGLTVEQYSLREQIEADKYLAGKCAAKNAGRGIRLTKLIPGGTA